MSQLQSARPVAFVPVKDAAAALAFYRDTLGLQFVRDDGFALVFDLGGATLRAARVQAEGFQPQPFTILSWHVEDIRAAVQDLRERGVAFERFDFLEQDEDLIWTAPGGAAKVAWFKDPSGNVLSVDQ